MLPSKTIYQGLKINRSGTDDVYRTLEAYIYDNYITFILATNILDLSATKYADEKTYIEISGFSEIEKILGQLNLRLCDI
ncbi:MULTISPECIES: hypothetical protein [Providencia]|uniref:Tle cognate immunity protein 4 N-terminal domain-containing protein n=1 Tax=Providencia stuartii TaxID=588 RepID=A0ABD5L7Y1_PROST|nr:hypothetical protein [Providencia rettgeri]ELR5290453.1 hypothetical protein [Providencia stuartii]URE80146.1 hypothetical protein MWH14_07540 [Providencia stuartii]